MRTWLVLFLSIGLTACISKITTKDTDLTLIKKDKVAGEVTMGAAVDAGIEPVVNQQKAFSEVLEQCKDWQYEGAILLNGYEFMCKKGDEQDCEVYQLSYKYQCLNEEEVKQYQEGKFEPRSQQNRLTTHK